MGELVDWRNVILFFACYNIAQDKVRNVKIPLQKIEGILFNKVNIINCNVAQMPQ